MLNWSIVNHIESIIHSDSIHFCSVADLIATNIKQKTEIGLHARDLLVHGEAVPDQMIARMLDIKMRSPEVAHHGLSRKRKSCFFFTI